MCLDVDFSKSYFVATANDQILVSAISEWNVQHSSQGCPLYIDMARWRRHPDPKNAETESSTGYVYMVRIFLIHYGLPLAQTKM